MQAHKQGSPDSFLKDRGRINKVRGRLEVITYCRRGFIFFIYLSLLSEKREECGERG